jgi:hypothetical protein
MVPSRAKAPDNPGPYFQGLISKRTPAPALSGRKCPMPPLDLFQTQTFSVQNRLHIRPQAFPAGAASPCTRSGLTRPEYWPRGASATINAWTLV